jgi:hypothetical protein
MVRPFTLRQLSLATNGLHVFSRISQMDQSLENRIRERAYEIWTAAVTNKTLCFFCPPHPERIRISG